MVLIAILALLCAAVDGFAPPSRTAALGALGCRASADVYVVASFFGRFSTTRLRRRTFFLCVWKLPMRFTLADLPIFEVSCARQLEELAR